MFGRATLTIVVSMISSIVAVITASVTTALRQPNSVTDVYMTEPFTFLWLLHQDGSFDGHARTHRILVEVRIPLENDLHRDALRDFDEVSGGVLRRHKRVRILRRRIYRVYRSLERHAFVRIDVDVDGLPRVHAADLRFLEVRGYEDLIRDEREHRRSRADRLTDFDALLADDAVHRGVDARIREILLGDLQRRALSGYLRGLLRLTQFTLRCLHAALRRSNGGLRCGNLLLSCAKIRLRDVHRVLRGSIL